MRTESREQSAFAGTIEDREEQKARPLRGHASNSTISAKETHMRRISTLGFDSKDAADPKLKCARYLRAAITCSDTAS
jgi:hypothetical protein